MVERTINCSRVPSALKSGNAHNEIARPSLAALPQSDGRSSTVIGTRRLTIFDAVSIIVGTIIGAGIFENAPLIARYAGSPFALTGIWVLGGILALGGAWCFAELTERYSDRVGGDYWFLRDAFGRLTGFLFAWASFWIIRPGNIGLMGLTFGRYASHLFPLVDGRHRSSMLYAFAAVLTVSCLNLRSLQVGKTTLNFLTLLKVVGLATLIVAGLILTPAEPVKADIQLASSSPGALEMLQALILVMFAYGGWNDLALVSGEIQKPEKNLFRALLVGLLVVIAIYVSINLAFVKQLGFVAMTHSEAVGSEMIERAFGSSNPLAQSAGMLCSLLVCFVCLSAINAMVITSPRIYAAVGTNYPALAWLNQWHGTREVPQAAITIQGLLTIALLLVVGFNEEEPFQALVNATTPVFFSFLALSFISLIIFRARGTSYRGFRTPFVPWLPAGMALISLAMVASSVDFLIRDGHVMMLLIIAVFLVFGLLFDVLTRPKS
jgi:basic amino acid/polyamine antiporter, APA family